MIELRDVFCIHRTPEGDAAALQGLTLEAARGELLCVLGPSGAGKSTMLRVIAGLQSPNAGIVNLAGRDIGRLPARDRARLRNELVGFLGQRSQLALSPDLRVARAVELPLVLRGVGRAARRERSAELLEAAGLRDRAGALPSELSGGERQRVALCAALAHRPQVLLADEPTGELDSASGAAVLELIVEVARAAGTTVVVVSHDPATTAIADRAVRIRDGRIVEDRSAGSGALVVGKGGWLQLPQSLLAQAGIRDRVRAEAVAGGLMVTPAPEGRGHGPGSPATETGAAAAPAALGLGRSSWRPAGAELRAVTRSRGAGAARRPVLNGIELSFAPGRMTAVTGRSGAGKTTLLRLLAGLDRPQSGEVVIDGRSLVGESAEALAALRRDRIGYLPQEPSPVGFLSAEENVVLALLLRGWERVAAAERTAVVLARVGLAERARQRVARLSAGEGQRVALARALASARGLLIADEPTSRLDQANASGVAGLLARAAADDGQTVICATHDAEVIRYADQVIAI